MDWATHLSGVLDAAAVTPAPEDVILAKVHRLVGAVPAVAAAFENRVDLVPFLAPDNREVPRLQIAPGVVQRETALPNRVQRRSIGVTLRILFKQTWWSPSREGAQAGGELGPADDEWPLGDRGLPTLEEAIRTFLRNHHKLTHTVNGTPVHLAEELVLSTFGTADFQRDFTVPEGAVARDLRADYACLVDRETGKLENVRIVGG